MFDDLLPETYTVSYAPDTSEYPDYISDSNMPGTIDGTAMWTFVSNVELWSIVLDRAQDSIGNDFWLIDPIEATIAGTVYFDGDENRDYTWDGWLSGYLVELLDSDGVVMTSMMTDTNGNYLFTDLPQGTYTIRYENTIWAYRADSSAAWTTGWTLEGMMISDIYIPRWANSVQNNFWLIPVRTINNNAWGGARVAPEEETIFLSSPEPELEIEEEQAPEITPEEEKIVEIIEVKKEEIEVEEEARWRSLFNAAGFVDEWMSTFVPPIALPATGATK